MCSSDLKNHSDIFITKLSESESLADISRVKKLSDNVLSLTICLGEKGIKGSSPFNKGDQSGLIIEIAEDISEGLSTLFNSFTVEALTEEFKRFEILPLEGYDEDALKTDVMEGFKSKRDFLVVDTYDTYKSFNSRGSMNQAIIEYMSDEYSNIMIDVYNNDIDSIRKRISPLLQETDWV